MSKPPLTSVERNAITRLQREAASGTFYGLLLVDGRATGEEVEAAYREYVRDWHPDRFYSRDAASHAVAIDDLFVQVTKAYKTLRDVKKRAGYDAELAARGVVVAQKALAAAAPEAPAFEVRLNRPPGSSAGPGGARAAPTLSAGAPAGMTPPAGPGADPAARSRSVAGVVAEKMRGQVADQLARAAGYYRAGLDDFEAGRFGKAESALYLAMHFDPQNASYAELFKDAQGKGRQGRAASLLAQGQQAEQYGSVSDALAHYKRAVECEPDEGAAYFACGQLLRKQDEDKREAMALLRKAVGKEPKRIEFRLALAELYVELNMAQNALREAQAASEVDPKNEKARALYKQLRQSAR
ncbi:MAG: tetratricopeptide repeat protein [Myxococcales bacterium]|nr:tetratricopeptide repeat protein [Myxococcales bacterium]